VLDLKIVNGTIVSDGITRLADVCVEGGVIVDVAPTGSPGRAAQEIDATDLIVLPGALDAHFHCRAPSHPERGDFASETRAAAAGGVTTIFEMPISEPPCSTPEVFQARRQLAEDQCYVDFALYAGGAVKSTAQALAMAECGAVAFKLFTHAPTPSRAHEFEGLLATSADAIYQALSSIRSTDLVCTVHAEDESLLQWFANGSNTGQPTRPPVVEAAAIAMVGALAADTGTRVHIAHVSSDAALRAVQGARHLGASMTAETCPHYLLFDAREVERLGAFAKVSPPLRDAEDREALWRGLNDGMITIVASDHAPFRPEEKREVAYELAPQGIPAVETMVPLLLDAALRGAVSLERAVEVLTSAPARLFGLYPRKGTVSPGADADLVLFAKRGVRTLRVAAMQSRVAGSGLVYEGLRLQGHIARTIVGGRTVYQDGRVLGEPRASFVRPSVAALRSA
jgi:allantoinase